MICNSTHWYSRTLFGLVLAGTLAVLGPADVWAQAASNVNCNKCVDTGDIAKKAVEKKQLAKNAVNSSRIADGEVKTVDLSDGAVTGAKIEDGAVELADLSPAVQQVTTDLEARVAAAEAAIATLETQFAAAQVVIAALQGSSVAALSAFLTVDEVLTDLDGDGIPEMLPRALFEGINVQVANGHVSQATDSRNGLGNLIVGYNEARTFGGAVCSDGEFDNKMDCENNGHVWASDHKSGSHNLVVGAGNAYSQTGGVVFGEDNAVARKAATITGGQENIARGEYSSVTAGAVNRASGEQSSVSGGVGNKATGFSSSISGGGNNTASGGSSSVLGGSFNDATMDGEAIPAIP